jgi:hypothetical protein
MTNQSINIWQSQQTITRRLLIWSGFSMAVGLGLQLAGPFWRGVGAQAVGWGLIDAGIAWFGRWSARRRQARLPDPLAAVPVVKETRNLRRLLWLNAGLDVGYMLAGWWLARTRGVTQPAWRGHGWGIIIQGGFLFLFDLYHALILPKQEGPK